MARLGTGSQESIMPLRILEVTLDSGNDFTEDVQEIELKDKQPIYDASGTRTQFKGEVKATVAVAVENKRRIVFL